MEFQSANQILRDDLGREWTIVEEYCYNNLHVALSDQRGEYVCRFLALIDVIKGRMQHAENKRHSDHKKYFDGIVADKLSADHLVTVAPGDISSILDCLVKNGITTHSEYESIKNDVSKLQTEAGCTRNTILGYKKFYGYEDTVNELEERGSLLCAFESFQSIHVLGEEMKLYCGSGEKLDIPHAVMLLGYGTCELKGLGGTPTREKYVVVQNTWGPKNAERGRVLAKIIAYTIAPMVPEFNR